MRILIYGINYFPELTGIGKYTAEMSSWLASQGHTVQVITGKPYYPEWEIPKYYKRKLWQKEVIDGVTIVRCPLYVPKKLTSFKRIAHELSFLAGVFPVWISTFFVPKFDVVIAISPPFHFGIMPLIYSKLKNSNLIIHVQDLQVNAAKNLSMIKNERFLTLMFKIERYIFRKSSAVSTITDGMLNKIKEKNIPNLKTILFPNWVDENFVYPLPKEKSMRKEFGISSDAKVILYSGNLGEKQGLEIIVEAARLFIGHSEVIFLIVGSGGQKDKLQNLAHEYNLCNIKFFPLAPYEKLSSLLATADIHLILQKKSASDLMMPSKLTGILASGGCPIVTALPGTSLYDIINNNSLGFIAEPESISDLVKTLTEALSSDLSVYRNNAREYAKKHLSKKTIMQNFQQKLIEMDKSSFVNAKYSCE